MSESMIVDNVLTAVASVAAAIGGTKAWDKFRSNGLSAKIDTVIERQERHGSKLDTMQADLGDVKQRIAKIEGWQSGRKEGREETHT